MLHARRPGGPVAAAQKAWHTAMSLRPAPNSWSLVGCDEGQEMYGVELYAAVRLAVVDEGLSHHEAGRRFGIDRRTVKKMLTYSAPPGYRRTKPVRRPKLDGFTGIVDAILEADTDPDVPRKQRHTAHRIFERLRDEHGFTGGYTIVKDYVRARQAGAVDARGFCAAASPAGPCPGRLRRGGGGGRGQAGVKRLSILTPNWSAPLRVDKIRLRF